jgi:hypothetical protein
MTKEEFDAVLDSYVNEDLFEKVDGISEVKEDDSKDKTVITEEQIYKDAQLKSAVDILKALMITSNI